MTPGWLTGYLGTIARLTGWPRDFILFELPIEQGNQLIHQALLLEGLRTVDAALGGENFVATIDQIREEVTNVGSRIG